MKRMIAAALIGVLSTVSLHGAGQQIRLSDLQGRIVDPLLPGSGDTAVVLLFVRTDCPISNRYAPEIRRLHERFAARGVTFRIVYPNPAESTADVEAHVRDFGYPGEVVRDPDHALVRAVKATVTPEAAVFDLRGRLVYRGRIDDRYLAFGTDRPAPTTHDLQEALDAVVAGRPVEEPRTTAVGCFLVDLR